MINLPAGWTKTIADLLAESQATGRVIPGYEFEWARAYERSLLPPGTRFPRDRDVFEAIDDVNVRFLTHWKAAFTGGGQGVLKKGTKVRVAVPGDSPEPIGMSAQALNAPEVELELVSEVDRRHPKYGGYSLSIGTDVLNTRFRLVMPNE